MMKLKSFRMYSLVKIESILNNIGMNSLGLLLNTIQPKIPLFLLSTLDGMMNIPLRQHKTQIQRKPINKQFLNLNNIPFKMLLNFFNYNSFINPNLFFYMIFTMHYLMNRKLVLFKLSVFLSSGALGKDLSCLVVMHVTVLFLLDFLLL